MYIGILPSTGFLVNDVFNQCLFSPNGNYRVCIEISSGSGSQQLTLYSGLNQIDVFPYMGQSVTVPDTGVVFHKTTTYLKTKNSCLSILNNNQNNFAGLVYSDCTFNTNDNSQYFTFYNVSNGYFVIRTSLGKCVDMAYSNNYNGGPLQLYECIAGLPQTWKFEDIGNGFWYIKTTITSNKCVTSYGDRSIRISDCNSSDTSQKWYFGDCAAGTCNNFHICRHNCSND